MRGMARLIPFAWLLAVLVPVHAAEWDVSEQTLDNGLHVIVRVDDRAPVAVSQLWYGVGSSYEHRGITGISHVLEHMMFKGTETLGPNEFSQIISEAGGRHNAFTGRDYTAYFEQLAADRLEIAFRLEADRMVNLRLDPDEFRKEVQVVLEERRLRTEDDPISLMGERFNAVAHPAGPYGQPIIGWPQDLRSLTVDDLRRWYERWYVPGNATLVVVGDVEPARVFELAERHFGDIPPATATPPDGLNSLDAPGERRITVRDERADVPHLFMGWEVPSAATVERREDVYALMVLGAILDGGDGARLNQRLIRDERIAASASAGYSPTSRLDTMLNVSAAPATDSDLERLEDAVREEITRLRRELVSAQELERATNQLLADELFGLDSTFYQAMQIGMLETIGLGWEALRDLEPGVRAVTAEDVRDVARRYLVPARLTVGRLLPGPKQTAEGEDE